jgi:tRNA A-37 threonylcarbamoyl transferase component Bud32
MLTTLLRQHGTLYEAATQLPQVTRLQGRAVNVVADFGGTAWVVRHYRRGGSVMKALDDRYLRTGSARVLHELQVTEAARERGIPTPEFMAGAWYDHGIFRRCDIATAYIPRSSDLAQIIFEQATARGDAILRAAQLIRIIIRLGLLHRDLNLKNLLLARSGAYIVDLDRCTLVDRLTPKQINAMRKRFFRSLAKWEKQTGVVVADSIKRTLAEAFSV